MKLAGQIYWVSLYLQWPWDPFLLVFTEHSHY